MYPNIFPMFIDQSKSFMPPVQKLKDLAIANVEKLVAFQVESVRSYADLGVAQWKEASKVNDPESFMDYLAKKSEHMFRVGDQAMADANKACQLGVDFVSDSQKMAQESVGVVKEMPTKKAARKAAA